MEIVTIDEDYDMLYEDPNPFYPFIGSNYELYKVLEMSKGISFFDLFYKVKILLLSKSGYIL